MMQVASYLEQRVRKSPKPSVVAQIVEGWGWSTALERWWWLDKRTLGDILSRHRKRLPPRAECKGRSPRSQQH